MQTRNREKNRTGPRADERKKSRFIGSHRSFRPGEAKPGSRPFGAKRTTFPGNQRTSPESARSKEAAPASVSTRIFELAAQIVSKADRQNPADAVLRSELRAGKDVSSDMGREISRVVFAFYRWWGWLDQQKPLPAQLHDMVQLVRTFAERPESFSSNDLAARAVPDWTREQLTVSPEWVRALQAEPKLWLRARAGQGNAVAEKLANTKLGPLPDAVLYEGYEDLFSRPEFHAGEFEIQDIASHAVSLLCAPQPGETWWDACAGEGGKTLHLSDLMQNKGLIWASDRAEWRLKKLKQRAGRAHAFNYRIAPWDGSSRLPTKTKFDGVLVDAPCSGLGTWQRNPHARWTTTPQDVAELGELQEQLLLHAAAAVKPGGKLFYAVCTLTRRETTDVVNAFERLQAEFQPLPLVNPFNTGSGAVHPLWLWPQDTGGNGMFVAAWVRAKG